MGVCAPVPAQMYLSLYFFFYFFCQSAFFVDLSLIRVSVGIGVLHLTHQVHI